MRANPIFILFCLVLLVACTDGRNAVKLHTSQIFVFGTLVDITFWDVDEALRERVVAVISQDFQRMHHEWHPWNPGPLLTLNQALARGEAAEAPDSLIPLIIQSRDLSAQSGGLFNPAIGSLLQLWGFQSSERPQGPPPSAEMIAAWRGQAPAMTDLELDGRLLRSRNPAVQLDFGAYAKGYAVDVAISHLQQRGIDNAIVNAGGDLRAIGSKDGQPWRIGIQHPQGEQEKLYAWLDVSAGEAVFTSGNYRRYREDQGIRYSHILDPRTGMPVDGVTSVTVIHHSGAIADAAATALVVAGPEQWEATALAMGIDQVMLVDDGGVVHMSPKMQQRVHFQDAPAVLKISEAFADEP